MHHTLVPGYQTLHCPAPGEQLASSKGAAGRGLPIGPRLDTKGRPGLSDPEPQVPGAQQKVLVWLGWRKHSALWTSVSPFVN